MKKENKVIACCSFKGGTAKTSVVLHLGYLLAANHDKKVLLLDLDPQANLTGGMGFSSDTHNTMAAVFESKKDIGEVIQKTFTDGLDILCANVYLDGIESTSPLSTDLYGHEKLRKYIACTDYDYIFIDTPPSLGWLTQSAFFAATHSIVCAIPEPYSILALNRLREYHDRIREHNPIELIGVILSFWDSRGANNSAYVSSVEAAFDKLLFNTKVRRDISVSKAVLKGLPVNKAFPTSRAAQDYTKLAKEFLKKVVKTKVLV